ncbi:toll/interleukin-1 receptor domain-containing protein [Mycobacterium sp. 134]|uniref:toll/interleukin-1 receptor domain-containing protein n=1 Tax=Mycobacterium sp. 134 TaxID=3400425 RepID=UPI003AAB92B2
MKKQHWNTLVASIRHGQCILVLGPEIPMDTVGTPADAEDSSFAEALTRELATELEENELRVTGTTLAAVAQQYEDAQDFGPNALRARAEKFYKSPQFVHSEIHNALAALPFSLILTTCQDDLMADALQATGKSPIVERYHLHGDKRNNPEFEVPNSPQAPLIYHLFGDAQEPGSLVLSENDLLDFLIGVVSDRPPLPNSLVRALKRNGQSFLFVGFGITQWYLRVLLKVLVRSLELHRTSSTIAAEPLRRLSEVDREQTILFYQRGTRIELEDADTRAFLTELKERLDAEGGFTRQIAPTGPCPRVFISYAHEDRDLACITFDALQKASFEPWWDSDALRGGDLWDERIRDELDVTDFTLVLYSPALSRKTDSYVNKEIALARERARKVRGPCLIPLRTADIATEDIISELSEYQAMSLRPAHFDDDIAKVISSMRRDYQRRHR